MKKSIIFLIAYLLVSNLTAQSKFTSYYGNGNIKEIGTTINSEKTGIWIRYDESGNKIAEAYFINGKKDGKWIIWDSSGIKRYEFTYELDKKTGEWLMFDEKGILKETRNYN
jgi:antitoxin component YwqK of YwqJK toxin-antitoxin module